MIRGPVLRLAFATLVVSALLGGPVIALTTPTTVAGGAAIYNYDWAAPNSHAAETSAPRAYVRADAGTPTNAAQGRGSARFVAFLAAEEGLATEAATGGAARGPSFIVHPNGEAIPVPEGAIGPTPVRTGKGFQFTGGSGGHGLDPRVTDVRVMDPVTTGKYQYPNGYVSYSNRSGQAVNPYTGQTLSRSDPWWHWAWGQ